MSSSSTPIKAKRKAPIWLIVVIIVVIIAVAVGALALSQINGGSKSSSSTSQSDTTGGNNNNSTGQNNGTGVSGTIKGVSYQLTDGEMLQFSVTTTTQLGTNSSTSNEVLKMVYSNVTSTGYDYQLTLTQNNVTTTYFHHGNFSNFYGNGTLSGYTPVLIGQETLSTPFGTKSVDHWQVTNVTASGKIVIDFYTGTSTPAMYKWVEQTTGSGYTSTMTEILTDTSNNAIKTGNSA